MRKKSMITSALIAGGLVIGGVLAGAVPANAAQSNCPSGESCTWGDQSYITGTHQDGLLGFTLYVPDFRAHDYDHTGENANDTASSVYNNGNTDTSYYYGDAHQTTYAFQLPTKTGDSNLGDSSGRAGAGHNDNLSSGYFQSCLNNGCL